jgi:hypothetical protein
MWRTLERQRGVNETIIKGPLAKKVLATDHFWRKAVIDAYDNAAAVLA